MAPRSSSSSALSGHERNTRGVGAAELAERSLDPGGDLIAARVDVLTTAASTMSLFERDMKGAA
jgi:hypothetical protein